MTLFGGHHQARQDRLQRLEETAVFLEQAEQQARARAPHINALAQWVADRKQQNGFGDDIEWTVRTPRGGTA